MTGGMTSATPTRDEALRRLGLAREARAQHARLRRDLKGGSVDPGAILREPPTYARKLRVLTFVASCPRYSTVRASSLLHSAGISPRKTLGGLSPRQRQALIEALGREVRGG